MARWPRRFLLYSAFCSFSLVSEGASKDLQRIDAHLALNDFHSAFEEVERQSDSSTPSIELYKRRLKILSKIHGDQSLLKEFRAALQNFPELSFDRSLLEIVAWGIIEHGKRSESVQTRLMSLIGSAMTQSAAGIAVIEELLDDPSAHVRAVAVACCAQIRDQHIQDKIFRLFETESCYPVRLQMIQTMGSAQSKKALPKLRQILESEKTADDEKGAALIALVSIMDQVDRTSLEMLVQSARAELRHLASRLIYEKGGSNDIDLLYILTRDPSAEVRLSALRGVGLLCHDKVEEVVKIARERTQDRDPRVVVVAAWLLAVYQDKQGVLILKENLENPKRQIRLLAAAALASTGEIASNECCEIMRHCHDPYLRINLAIGLLCQRSCESECCDVIAKVMQSEKQLWMWHEEAGFRILCPTQLKHRGEANRYPEAADSMTRLELIQLLSTANHPNIEEVTYQFVTERSFGVTGAAIALLLTEGNDDSLESVKNLLEHPEYSVRLQAALILALWCRDEEVIDVLHRLYLSANRDMKDRILEGIGRIASQSSIPFLLEKIKEPQQNLRIIAAAALLQCLYR
ncbi:MAG: hypothetical protein Tsb0021_07730 [Chlamydiales bacterium]